MSARSNAQVTGGGSSVKVLHAHSYGLPASANQARCPACNSQNACTGADGVMMISTRLRDCDFGYGNKTESVKRRVINNFKACATCTKWTHATVDCSTHRHTKERNNEEGSEAERNTNLKAHNSPEAVHKCPVCSRCHSYVRNNGVARHSSRLRDCKE